MPRRRSTTKPDQQLLGISRPGARRAGRLVEQRGPTETRSARSRRRRAEEALHEVEKDMAAASGLNFFGVLGRMPTDREVRNAAWQSRQLREQARARVHESEDGPEDAGEGEG